MIAINPQTLTVTRPGVTTYVNHVPVEAASTSFQIVAEVQPMSGSDRVDLPEGYRATRTLKMYTESSLNVADVPNQRISDLVAYQGETFEVIAEDDRSPGPWSVTHRKYTLARTGVDE